MLKFHHNLATYQERVQKLFDMNFELKIVAIFRTQWTVFVFVKSRKWVNAFDDLYTQSSAGFLPPDPVGLNFDFLKVILVKLF